MDAITEVLQGMQGESVEVCKRLETVLYMVLSKYDIREKTTEIQCVDESWQTDIQRFLIRKHIDGKSDRTLKNYEYHLRRVLSFLNKSTGDITESDLLRYFTVYKQQRKVSNRYMDDIRLVISSFFTWQHNKGFIVKNPAAGLDPIKCEKRIKKPFSDEELELLRMNCSRERDLAMVEFLYSTGVRVSELTALNRNNIDFDGMDVVVYGKGSKERETYLTATSCLHLKKYLQMRKDDNAALFVSLKAPYERLTAQGVQEVLRRIGNNAGIEKVHPHRFRRTLATNVLKKGMPLEEVKELLGHSKLDTTMIYCTVSQDNVRHSHKKYMCA